MPRPLPLGEVDLRSKDGEGEPANQKSSCDKNTPYAKGATTHHLRSGSFFMIAYFRLNFSGSKSGSSQKRVMISV